jgi:D-glycero-alpha-D-manno-heptose-7-phosphate kinase
VIITQTPLRISLAGGGTDLRSFYLKSAGSVLSSAIDKFVFVILQKRFDDKIYVNYSRKEIVDDIEELQHELVREAMRKAGVHRGIEITFLADVPSGGSGLGSSSSVTVGLLNALYLYLGRQETAERLAREACEIEIDILGKPIGKQDQYIAAYGGLRELTFQPSGDVGARAVEVSDLQRRMLGDRLLLFFTGVTRSADDILRDQSANIPASLEILRAMAAQPRELRAALEGGDLGAVGRALLQGWERKKALSARISNAEIERLHERALAAGAEGGKISGAGGGGFLLLYCEPERQPEVRRALSELRELAFDLERDGSKAIFNIRR